MHQFPAFSDNFITFPSGQSQNSPTHRLASISDMPLKSVCQKQACAIQTCLQANKYKESMCQDLIKDMRRCCDLIGNHSTCCEGFLRDQKPTQNTATLST